MTDTELFTVAEIALDHVVRFYEKKGLALTYRPGFALIPESYPVMDNFLMGVSIESTVHEALITQLTYSFEKETWKHMAGIEISDGAVEEIVQWNKKILTIAAPLPLDPKMIYLYPRSSMLLQNHRRFSAIVAHEYWHLIEQEHGVITDTPLIGEGTARYVEERYTNTRPLTSIESAQGFFPLYYSGAAMIVAAYLSNDPSNYAPLLDPAIRKSIQKEFVERTKPVIAQKLLADLESLQFKKALYDAYVKIPEYRELCNGVSKDSLLNAFIKQGKSELVREIKDKDLTKVIQYWKDLGFNE